MEGSKFENFKQRTLAFLKSTAEDVDCFCWEVLFDIVEGTEAYYEFDFEHLRLTSDFLMAAVLLSVLHNKKVVVLEPTAYYSYQAVQMFRDWKLDAPNLSICTVGAVDLKRGVDVIFHHGRKFNIDAPEGIRQIVQLFQKETVPQDSRSLSSLICAAQCDHRDD